MMTIYLASPLGFSPELRGYRDRIKLRLSEIGCDVFDPWTQTLEAELKQASAVMNWPDRVIALAQAARQIGRMNEEAIGSCDKLFAVLDGSEPDSGTVCELGFAAGLGKTCYGLRTDFRDLGDFDGLPINLQILYFIESSGGRLFRRIDDIEI